MWRVIEKYGVVFCRYYLGGFNLVSGLNYFILFWPWVPLPHIQMSVTRNLIMHVILLAAYANYFLPMLKSRAAPQPIWRRPARLIRSL